MTLVRIPWQPNLFVHVDLLEKLQAIRSIMGRPPMLFGPNSGWRSYAQQKALWDAYQNGSGNVASNPDTGNRTHMRGVAADLADTSDAMQRACVRVGLQRDPVENWHWQLPTWRAYPIIPVLPAPSEKKDDTMLFLLQVKGQTPVYVVGGGFDYQFADKGELDAFTSVVEASGYAVPKLVVVPSTWTVNLFRRACLPTASAVAVETDRLLAPRFVGGAGGFTADDRARLQAVPTAVQNGQAARDAIVK